MEFTDRLQALSKKAFDLRSQILTEEASKSSLVMPFIQLLGYDVFNPLEVVPEFTADVGIKKGERVDYAIVSGSNPIIIIECKPIDDILDQQRCGQLFRYFSNTSARIAILTNGVKYKFFTDLEKSNLMDNVPYMVIDLLNLDESLVRELKKL